MQVRTLTTRSDGSPTPQGSPESIPIPFQRLSFAFTVGCNEAALADYVSRVLVRFAALDVSAGRRAYELLDRGPSDPLSRYRLFVDGTWVLGSGLAAHVIDDLFSHINRDTVEATRESVLVHAGAVVSPNGSGVMLPAPSGSGKSTLVAGLVRAGFGYLSDEASVLDPQTGGVHPYPVHLSLKGPSRDRFPEARPAPEDRVFVGDRWHVDPDAIRPGAVAPPCEVGFVIAHRFEPGATLRVERLTPAAACMELGANLMLGRRESGRALELLARVCRGARSYRLVHGDLDIAVTAIAELTGG